MRREPRIEITQVLVRILILIKCIINALAVQKIVVYMKVLVSRRHAMIATAATWCACITLLRGVTNRVSACVKLIAQTLCIISSRDICARALHVEQKMLFVLILHFVLSLAAGYKPVTVVLSRVPVHQGLPLRANKRCWLTFIRIFHVDLRKA